ncbi:Class I alpha-mannosidase [Penicillium chermesinum]|uniref:alpha-1,2-Mannosidase n=1 Tax=Penicillium chermesinum TaxID=63820 RepID=A0A9W9TBU8_9EURO|nr:Class I alpha-mannosidase [Penicillium chermesinum]KAJ5216978.1 Class I alpha-mannosidase [Penicillium chermesinum]
MYAGRSERYPVRSYIPLPSKPLPIPRIQYDFPEETKLERKVREKRKDAVKETFMHAWNGYKDRAWLRDEVSPQSGRFVDSFSGWGATLVDSLDSLVIMGLEDEFKLALEAIEQIDFTTTRSEDVNVFEIVIRYMGGFLAAHDLTHGKYPTLLQKAEELGDMIFNAFDTHNRMPQVRWEWTKSAKGQEINPLERTYLAELGSFSVEFTRLTQLTRNPKYYDAIQRITDVLDDSQMTTRVPGLWPLVVSADRLAFDGYDFSMGALADSTYEYLPKEHILLGAQTDQYERMYTRAFEAMKKHLLFRAMTPDEDKKILFTSDLRANNGGYNHVTHSSDHLKCYIGGTVALAAKIFRREKDLEIARGLTDGCIWAYDSTPSGVMPEIFKYVQCADSDQCPWDKEKWQTAVLGHPPASAEQYREADRMIVEQNIPPGFASYKDLKYQLRRQVSTGYGLAYVPEHRQADSYKYGHSTAWDVREPDSGLSDKMESFWLAETLKYLYLIFSEPHVVSLDDYEH